MNNATPVRAEDVMSVRSRVNWGAVLAGSVIALALYFLLTLIGGAVGLSVSGHVRPSSVGTGAAVWAVLSIAVALFVGGWVTSQLTVGENRGEAAMHGVLLWGLLFGMLLWLMASGVRSGFNAMVGMAQAGQAAAPGSTAGGWEEAARRAGVSAETIDEWRRKAADAPAVTRQAAENPENQQAAADAATRVTWWAVVGALLSMAAAVLGAIVGARPTSRLLASGVWHTRPGYERREAVVRQ